VPLTGVGLAPGRGCAVHGENPIGRFRVQKLNIWHSIMPFPWPYDLRPSVPATLAALAPYDSANLPSSILVARNYNQYFDDKVWSLRCRFATLAARGSKLPQKQSATPPRHKSRANRSSALSKLYNHKLFHHPLSLQSNLSPTMLIKNVMLVLAAAMSANAAPMTKRWVGAPPCSSDPATQGNQGCISPQDDPMAFGKYLECDNGAFMVRELAAGTVCQGVDGFRVIGVTAGGQGCTTGQQRCKDPGALYWNSYEECIDGAWTTRSLAEGTACQALPDWKIIGVTPGSAPM